MKDSKLKMRGDSSMPLMAVRPAQEGEGILAALPRQELLLALLVAATFLIFFNSIWLPL